MDNETPLPPISDLISDIKSRLFKLEHDVNNLARLTQLMYEQLQGLAADAGPVINKYGSSGPKLTPQPQPDTTIGSKIELAKAKLKDLKLII